jgi:hypothetical protein
MMPDIYKEFNFFVKIFSLSSDTLHPKSLVIVYFFCGSNYIRIYFLPVRKELPKFVTHLLFMQIFII